MKGKKQSFQKSLQKCTPGLLHSFSKKEYYQRAQKKSLFYYKALAFYFVFISIISKKKTKINKPV